MKQQSNHEMRKAKGSVWIVSAHFPPSNLVSVHRARLLANHLSVEGWSPTVLTVAPQFYEERLDPDLEKLVDPSVRLIRVRAFSQRIARPMGWGDISLRAWWQLYRALARGARRREMDLVYITMPANYQALLGRLLWERHRVPYVIDYTDPWVNESDLGERFPSKAWASQFLAQKLEPIAVAKVSGLAGITPEYFAGVLRRNPHLAEIPKLTFQMGCSWDDYEKVQKAGVEPRRIEKNAGVRQIVYAGALLPKAIEAMRCFLRALSHANNTFLKQRPIRFVCIGTGRSPNDPNGHQILPLARTVGAEDWVREYPERHPYMEVLATLMAADGIVVVGSTEPHYSPSKIFQAVRSRRPLLALLHRDSEAVDIVQRSGAGVALTFGSQIDEGDLLSKCLKMFAGWPGEVPSVRWDLFEHFDAFSNAARVARFYDEVLEYHRKSLA